MRLVIKAKDKNKAKKEYCEVCGSRIDLVLHHITPFALGGTNEADNLQTMCRYCHNKVHKWLHIPREPFIWSAPRMPGIVRNNWRTICRLSEKRDGRVIASNDAGTLMGWGISPKLMKERGAKNSEI